MPRRARLIKRKLSPDPKYGSYVLARLIKKIMQGGKKATAEHIVYDALNIVIEKLKTDPLEAMDQALKNVTPLLQIKARRVGGATYQVPVEVQPERGQFMAIGWLVGFARARSGKSMAEKLASEIIEATKGEGSAVKKRQDTHKMAEANKAFAHFRW
jgi:small subunit ribosomal protein S7